MIMCTPLVSLATFMGEVEQDYLYWTLKYKGLAERWRTETEWGRLLQRCQQQVPLF
jgi:hypothetical protein